MNEEQEACVAAARLANVLHNEEIRMVNLYLEALKQLRDDHHKWSSNLAWYFKQDLARRVWWIKCIERQAAAGLPMAGEVVARVLAVRMTG